MPETLVHSVILIWKEVADAANVKSVRFDKMYEIVGVFPAPDKMQIQNKWLADKLGDANLPAEEKTKLIDKMGKGYITSEIIKQLPTTPPPLATG